MSSSYSFSCNFGTSDTTKSSTLLLTFSEAIVKCSSYSHGRHAWKNPVRLYRQCGCLWLHYLQYKSDFATFIRALYPTVASIVVIRCHRRTQMYRKKLSVAQNRAQTSKKVKESEKNKQTLKDLGWFTTPPSKPNEIEEKNLKHETRKVKRLNLKKLKMWMSL
ncbi:hypothetical protein OUZ56_005765 [Daphnia magna]|uniref:Uncharacterized protein n=1 Tax=Daphnia magna TaxID=35525 RepID=A0ABQ9YTQ6_9CRUS|nr:hypothetical protein OUZ56_005765 [Daphnia magna]